MTTVEITNEASQNPAYDRDKILACLYDKPYRCPCCDAEFTERAVKDGSIKLVREDRDLRLVYEPLDPILYDIVICRNCGYSSLSRTFDNLSFKKAQLVTQKISSKYKHINFPQIFTEDIAVIRYKAALMTALLTREKSSEIAYLYMRLGWIYRSMGEEETEKKMLLASFEGFLEAIQKEYYPFIDLSENATLYIMGEILYRLSKNEQAALFFRKVLRSGDLSSKIKKKIQEHPVMQ